MRAILVPVLFLIALTSIMPTLAESIFRDDFSSDTGWISIPPSDIARDATDNNVHWHVDRSYDQMMYQQISSLTGDFKLRVDAIIDDASNNCNIDIGLVNDINNISGNGNLLIRIGFYGGGTPYYHWYAQVLGRYNGSAAFSSMVGEVTPSNDTLSGYVPIIPGNWYTYDLTKNASTWDLKVYDFNEVKVGSISGKLTGSLPSFNYLYIGNENTNDWPSANGKIDNIELATSGDLCSDPTPLRHLAEFSGIKIGSAVKSDPLTSDSDYRETLSKEFDMLVSEYEMKFDQIWPDLADKPEATSLSERMVEPHFQAGNSLCEFAKNHNMVVRGHTLIWHEALPKWLTKEDAGLSDKNRVWTQNDREELLAVMGKHINTTVKYYEEHYNGTVVCWDVVNEAINESSPYVLRKNSTWYKGIGEDYIDKAFQYAHNADMADGHKDLELFYNDYGGEAWNEKADAIYELVCKLKDRGVPIDGVGFQMHIYDMNKNPVDEKLASNIKRFTDKGFDVHITEMEVWPKKSATMQDLELQSKIYKDVMNICLQNPRVTAFVVWGFTDKHVWMPEEIPDYKKDKDLPCLFDESYQKKLAYCGLQEALRNKLTTSTSTTTSSPPTGTTRSTTTTTAAS